MSFCDTVYDLGSGDGRLLFAALEKGAGKAIGVELDPGHVSEAKKAAKEKGLKAKIVFLHADVMDVNLSDATVVFCYLFTTASTALKPKFAAELKPSTRIVMESSQFMDGSLLKLCIMVSGHFIYIKCHPRFSHIHLNYSIMKNNHKA